MVSNPVFSLIRNNNEILMKILMKISLFRFQGTCEVCCHVWIRCENRQRDDWYRVDASDCLDSLISSNQSLFHMLDVKEIKSYFKLELKI